ncbi:MAG: aminopeptidase [Bacteroidota bacterium]
MSLRRLLRFFIYAGVLFLFVVGFCYFSLLQYAFSQALGFYRVRKDCVSLHSLASTPEYSKKYLLIQKAFAFAAREGLDTTDAYKWYLPCRPDHRLVVVSASTKNRIAPHTWHFPLLGSVPYKGFYERHLMLREIESLATAGFDTDTSEVEAWSALGWMSEILSEQTLQKDDTTLTGILFHELTHRKIYLYDAPDLNENLAQACGTVLNRKFWHLAQKQEDREAAFARMMCRLSKRGNRLYAACSDKRSLYEARKFFIRLSIDSVYESKWLSTQTKKRVATRIGRSVNAYFSDYENYYSSKDSLENILVNTCKGKLPVFFARFKKTSVTG